MKKILITALFGLFSSVTGAQSAAEQLADRIAQKMKDSLSLTDAQRQQIYTINMDITARKQAARAISNDRSHIGRQIQQIENSRDSLYKPVLGEEKFMLYKQKKTSLISYQ